MGGYLASPLLEFGVELFFKRGFVGLLVGLEFHTCYVWSTRLAIRTSLLGVRVFQALDSFRT